jgi:hypothetical protein
MASSLRVNAIVPASGTNVAIGTAGGTITYTANVSGVSTFSSGVVIGTGASIASPATNILTIGTNNTERIRVGAAGSIGIGTDNPTKFIDITGVHSGINTTGRFVMSPHSSGWDTGVTSGSIHHHYTDGFRLYSGQIGSGILRWNIDNSGRVTMPYQPSFCASKTVTEQTTGGTIVFNSDSGAGRHNVGSHYSTSTGTFTCPVAGRYVFMCSIHSTNGTNKVDVRLRVNGSDSPGGFALNNVDSYTQATGCAVLNLAANDAVTIYNANGGVWPDAGLTYFSGYLVG